MTHQLEQRKGQILLLVGLFFSLGTAFTLNRVPFIRAKSDVYLRWYATTKLFAENRNLYDARNGEEILQLVYTDEPAYEKTNFYYPSTLLLFTAPLAWLPYLAAHFIWTTAVQLFYLAALWLLSRELHWPDTMNKTTLFLATAALFIPSLQHTIWGQFNTIGVLGLALCYLALRREQYGLAGIWSVSLTFKPQTAVLLLAFLLLWAIWQQRWRFILGFMLAGAGLWAAAELSQPGWLFDWAASLSGYIPVQSVLDQLWNPHQLAAGGLLLTALAFFIRSRDMTADSLAFVGCLSFSMAVWALIVPIVGMMHAVILPPVLVMLLAGYKRSLSRWYRPVLYTLAVIYVGGWIGFIWGLTDQSLYGQHIQWSETAYKIVLPTFIALLAGPFCWQSRFRTEKL